MGPVRAFALALTGIAGSIGFPPLASAQATTSPSAKAFKFTGTGYVILPAETAPDPATKDFREHDEVFRAMLGLDHVGKLDEPASFELFGKTVTIDARSLLTVGTATGGDLGRFPADTVIMCRDPDDHFVKQLAAATTLMLSTLFSRFSTWTQVCLADTDRDGAVEHAFMVGTRMAPDRRLFPIAPVRYRLGRNVPLTNSYLTLRYLDPAAFAGARLEATVMIGGQPAPIDGMRLGPDRKWAGALYKIKDAKLPQTIEIAGAQVVAERLTADRKVLSARVSRDVTLMPFEYVLRPNVIYISY